MPVRCPKCGSTNCILEKGGEWHICLPCDKFFWIDDPDIAWLRRSHAELLAALKAVAEQPCHGWFNPVLVTMLEAIRNAENTLAPTVKPG